jgi:hypothetical protein
MPLFYERSVLILKHLDLVCNMLVRDMTLSAGDSLPQQFA